MLDVHGVRRRPESIVCMVAIAKQIARSVVEGEGLAELLCRPRRGRMRRDRDVDAPTPMGAKMTSANKTQRSSKLKAVPPLRTDGEETKTVS